MVKEPRFADSRERSPPRSRDLRGKASTKEARVVTEPQRRDLHGKVSSKEARVVTEPRVDPPRETKEKPRTPQQLHFSTPHDQPHHLPDASANTIPTISIQRSINLLDAYFEHPSRIDRTPMLQALAIRNQQRQANLRRFNRHYSTRLAAPEDPPLQSDPLPSLVTPATLSELKEPEIDSPRDYHKTHPP